MPIFQAAANPSITDDGDAKVHIADRGQHMGKALVVRIVAHHKAVLRLLCQRRLNTLREKLACVVIDYGDIKIAGGDLLHQNEPPMYSGLRMHWDRLHLHKIGSQNQPWRGYRSRIE